MNWFIDIPNYKFENGEMRRISDLEDEIDSHYFIKILWEYKYIDEYIEKKVIELIDEKIIHYKLREKYFELFPKKFEEEEKEKNLKKLAKELGYKIERLKW